MQAPAAALGKTGMRERILPRDHFNIRIPAPKPPLYRTSVTVSPLSVAPRPCSVGGRLGAETACPQVVPIKACFSYCGEYERFQTLSLDHNAIVESPAQSVTVARTREANRIERKRQVIPAPSRSPHPPKAGRLRMGCWIGTLRGGLLHVVRDEGGLAY
jgi:hypothetical protein